MDGSPINFLKTNLRKQIQIYKDIIDLLKKEKSAIVEYQLDLIKQCTFEKEIFFEESTKIEFERQKWIQDLSVQFQDISNQMILTDVVQKVDPAQFDSVNQIKNALKVLVEKARTLNSQNCQLAENALFHTEKMKENVLGLSKNSSRTYGASGKVNASEDKSPRMIVQKA